MPEFSDSNLFTCIGHPVVQETLTLQQGQRIEGLRIETPFKA